MKVLAANLPDMQNESWVTDGVLETIEAMNDDERILLYENGIEFILWLREKNPSLLATLAADIRERRTINLTDRG